MAGGLTAENALIGSILLEESVLSHIRGIVCVDDFTSQQCAAVFAAAENLAASGSVIDPITIMETARRAGVEIDNDWIKDIWSLTPTAANAVIYAQQVREESRRRRIKALAESIADNPSATADELLANLQQIIENDRGASSTDDLLSSAECAKLLLDAIEDGCDDDFVKSGYSSLDALLGGGFLRGGLYIIGARPAAGKTTFSLNLAEQIDGSVLFVSLETKPKVLSKKRFSRLTGIPTDKMGHGHLDEKERELMAKASAIISRSGVKINKIETMTTAEIGAKAQAIPNLCAVIVDHLCLVLPATPCASTYERVSAVSRELKLIASQLNVPVICLAQLNRCVESREDKHPRLSDLRDSGSIEQDADSVIFLYREDYYTGNADGGPSIVELDVAKNRHGPTGKVELLANLRRSLFWERKQ